METVSAILKKLLHSSMLLYFTDRAPLVISVKNWAKDEFQEHQGWPIEQVKLIGNNFFLVSFIQATDRDTTLKATSWFMFHHFVFTTT